MLLVGILLLVCLLHASDAKPKKKQSAQCGQYAADVEAAVAAQHTQPTLAISVLSRFLRNCTANDNHVRARTLDALGTAYIHAKQYQESVDVLREALEIRMHALQEARDEEDAVARRADVILAQASLAHSLQLNFDLTPALELVDQAVSQVLSHSIIFHV